MADPQSTIQQQQPQQKSTSSSDPSHDDKVHDQDDDNNNDNDNDEDDDDDQADAAMRAALGFSSFSSTTRRPAKRRRINDPSSAAATSSNQIPIAQTRTRTQKPHEENPPEDMEIGLDINNNKNITHSLDDKDELSSSITGPPDATTSTTTAAAAVGSNPLLVSQSQSQSQHSLPPRPQYPQSQFNRGGRGGGERGGGRGGGGYNREWYLNYYDPSSNENPWWWLENRAGLESETKEWLEHAAAPSRNKTTRFAGTASVVSAAEFVGPDDGYNDAVHDVHDDDESLLSKATS